MDKEYTVKDVAIDYLKEIGILNNITPVEVPRTCEHCKWWNIINITEGFSNCTHPKIGTGSLEPDGAWIDYGDIVTGKLFGCLLWEEKE